MKTEQKPEMTKEEFAEKWVGINNGEKHCSAPTDCYYRISDTNICTDPGEGHERCKWNKEPSDLFLSDLRSVLRGKLIEYDNWLARQSWGLGEIPTAEKAVDEFLNNNQ